MPRVVPPLDKLRALAKSAHGEGSRGGKIIGHSKSGHAIYEHHGKFEARHASFDKVAHEPGDFGREMVVPLIHGYKAVREIQQIHRSGHMVEPETQWRVVHPDGRLTQHELADDFHDAAAPHDSDDDERIRMEKYEGWRPERSGYL